MSDPKAVKQRGLEVMRAQYQEYTMDDVHPYGEAPWAGGTPESQSTEWQRELDETGIIPTAAALTRDQTTLSRWIAASEEIAGYSERGEEVPKKVAKAADKAWDKAFKEPKVKERKQTIQMFLALPEGRRAEYGNFPVGILYDHANPMTVEQVGAAVCALNPESKYNENPVNRARIDILKFNKGLFSCQAGVVPEVPYPLLGLPEKTKKEEPQTAE